MDKKWTTKDFPVGSYRLNSNTQINFQMNRFFRLSNDPEMLAELKNVGSQIHDYGDFIQKFLQLGVASLSNGKKLNAALYFRGAEFFIKESDPRKQKLRNKFIELINGYYGITTDQHFNIPYGAHHLSAYRYQANVLQSKGTIMFVGGFDGYIEESTKTFLILRDAGYNVIAFEGPGQ